MPPKLPAAEAQLRRGAGRGATFGAWLRWAEKLLAESGVALGQVATNPHDEALYLILHAVGLPLDSDASVSARKLSAPEQAAVIELFRRRVVERVPSAYLTHEAWLGGHRFYVDERVLIPRSYFLEIIPQLAWTLPTDRPLRLVDVCTGSGCLAILLALAFPKAKIDAVDLSDAALEVARINVKAHRLSRRVILHASDVFDAVPAVRYDVILSNPPYEPSSRVNRLAKEFRQEPRLALDGGADGLTIIRKLLRQAASRLAPRGVLLIEVGGLQAAIDREFSALKPEWLATEDGSNCICQFRAENLRS